MYLLCKNSKDMPHKVFLILRVFYFVGHLQGWGGVVFGTCFVCMGVHLYQVYSGGGFQAKSAYEREERKEKRDRERGLTGKYVSKNIFYDKITDSLFPCCQIYTSWHFFLVFSV